MYCCINGLHNVLGCSLERFAVLVALCLACTVEKYVESVDGLYC